MQLEATRTQLWSKQVLTNETVGTSPNSQNASHTPIRVTHQVATCHCTVCVRNNEIGFTFSGRKRRSVIFEVGDDELGRILWCVWSTCQCGQTNQTYHWSTKRSQTSFLANTRGDLLVTEKSCCYFDIVVLEANVHLQLEFQVEKPVYKVWTDVLLYSLAW